MIAAQGIWAVRAFTRAQAVTVGQIAAEGLDTCCTKEIVTAGPQVIVS
jgi:hypothetical protein